MVLLQTGGLPLFRPPRLQCRDAQETPACLPGVSRLSCPDPWAANESGARKPWALVASFQFNVYLVFVKVAGAGGEGPSGDSWFLSGQEQGGEWPGGPDTDLSAR